MQHITWLHLSDWHQKGSDFGRTIVRDALIKDLRDRKQIAPELTNVDFVVFSGDLAFSGAAAEYEAARKELLDPVLDAVRVGRDRLIIVPGNHDLDREYIPDLAPELQKAIDSEALIQKWLAERRLPKTLEPFEAYRKFVSTYTGRTAPDYASVLRFDVRGTKIGIVGLNSAWMTGRNKDTNGVINDYGFTLIGEQQIHNSLQQIAEDKLRIAVMHHPFDWLNMFDRNRTESRLYRACHFILCGHVHDTQVQVIQGTAGEAILIPAGASYERRTANNPRYTNAYNWVSLDLEAAQASVYLRRWSDKQNEWIEDTDTYRGGKFVIDDLPKELHKKSVDTSVAAPPAVDTALTSRFERERTVLEGYLDALIRNNTDLEPGGIKQTKVRVVLPLDSIYVGLQADRDRPDVDRRVMQEELDEIKKNLEREEDPKEREKQYQIWANHSRVIQKALEISGPREELSTIVQRHRQVVILGDPGSGKTTLVRYLTLCLARAVRAEPERLFERQELWEQKKVWSLPDLGPVRLPILLRISHYAEARQKDPDLALVDYLPRYFAGLSVPHADELGSVLQTLLDQGRCMVLLDGLDEIIDPSDRRNIAAAIGQFASVYRETGLPDWLAHLLSHTPARAKERLEVHARSSHQDEELNIQWATDMPQDVREEWEKRIKQRRQEWERRGRAVRMAWELLDEARYAHVGNRFVVTSRIAGYHFAGVPGEFEHFTIRRMGLDDIKLFLEKWCPAVERRIAEAPDRRQVDQRSQREIDGILKAVQTTPGVRRMAENPLLLRILAVIHRNEAHLPQRRVELYETASVTLLRDWHLERGTPKGAVIDDVKATSLLGPLALYIHENRASGFLSKGETERILGGILARERGENDPEQPSLETREAVQDFLETVREHSGLFVERGEGLYGFMHLTFEEYFTARQLVSSATRARGQILQRLHQPRWREPILLAVGSLSKQFYDDTQDLLRAILEANSAYEEILHRDLLFAAACIGDSVNVAPVLRYQIARKLLALYCDRRGAGRFNLLQQQIRDALLTLCNDAGDAAVEMALAETLTSYKGGISLNCALDVVDWLQARTTVVADALANHPSLNEVPRAEALLRTVQARAQLNDNSGPRPTGWDAVRDNAGLAGLLGAFWQYGWSTFLFPGLKINSDASDSAGAELHVLRLDRLLESSRAVVQLFTETPRERRNAEFWDSTLEMLDEIWKNSDADSPIEKASAQLLRACVDSRDYEGDAAEAAYRIGLQSLSFAIDESETIMSVETALSEFADTIRRVSTELGPSDHISVLQSAGFYLLNGITSGHTLAAIFALHVPRFDSFKSVNDDDGLSTIAQSVQLEIGQTLVKLLQAPASAEQYEEAVACLAPPVPMPFFPIKGKPESDIASVNREAAEIVARDLESDDTSRLIMALRTLVSPAHHQRLNLSKPQKTLLLNLLDSSSAQATLALEILFATGLSAELLAWCWSVLRQPDHPLKDVVLQHLGSIGRFESEAGALVLIDQGLHDDSLRPYALELLHRMVWRGMDTFIPAVSWLTRSEGDVRHLAAISLASRDDLLAVPRSTLLERRPPEVVSNEWSSLQRDAQMVRMLSGLWRNDWADALTLLSISQTAGAFVSNQLGRSSINLLKSAELDDAIRSLLEKATFGHSLIPLFKKAANRLAEIEGPHAHGEPSAENIAAIQSDLVAQAGAQLREPNISAQLRVDLISFLFATQSEHLLFQAHQSDGYQPLREWVSTTLAHSQPEVELNTANFALLLKHDEFDTRAAAALSLLWADLPSVLVTALMEAAQSSDDRVRTKGRNSLTGIGGKLASDGSTNAPTVLLASYVDAETRHDAIMANLLFNSLTNMKHKHSFWVRRWLEVNRENETESRLALVGLTHVSNASTDVLSLICKVLNSPTYPLDVRRALTSSVRDMLRLEQSVRSNEMLLTALTAALNDPDEAIRNDAAYGLQWTSGQSAWTAAIALQRVLLTDDPRVRIIALISLGRVLSTVRGFREVDISREALFRWLQKHMDSDEFSFDQGPIAVTVESLSKLLDVADAPDAAAVLAKLSEPASLDLPQARTEHLIESAAWNKLISDAREEWDMRKYWIDKLPFLPATIAKVENLLSDSDAAVRRTAARAMAWIYHGEDDRPARLRELLHEDLAVLLAMMDAVADSDTWIDDVGFSSSHHPWAVKQIVSWLEAKPTEERATFIDLMMDRLDKQLVAEAEGKDGTEGYAWPGRRILTAVLAELSERLTYRAFINTRPLANVVDLFARAARDQSFDVRRFAIRTLGNLQQLTDSVADVFFTACQDVSSVYNETRTAVTKFKVFDAGSLERLTAAIREPSITVAYHAALLLGELGLSRSEDLGPAGRKRVADELVLLLDAPLAARTVYDFARLTNGSRVGPLYDVIYEALVRVVAGPDAPARLLDSNAAITLER
ncbi:MAG TPA: metallophosphoesterase [Pyrinomonadaceae bacterium]|nr:metallophosphoesterase [Pyrinomonadaceae bacterium]